MEFESNQGQPSEIDDAARFAATTKRLTLTPVSSDLAADDLPDTLVAAQHAIEPAIANLPTDAEVTPNAKVDVVVAKKNHGVALACGVLVTVVLGTVTAFALMQ